MRSFDSWRRSEVLDSFSRSGSSQDESVLACRVLKCELIEGSDRSSSSKDSLPCALCHTESNDVELWHLKESVIVGHSGHTHGCDAIFALHMLSDSGDGDGSSHGVTVLEESEDSEVELVLSSSGEEGVQLQGHGSLP